MPDGVSMLSDSVVGAKAPPQPMVIAALSDSALIKDTSSHIQVPVWMDTVSATVKQSSTYPLRHDGLLRPVSMVSETFLFASLLCVVFIMNRVVRNGSRFIPEILKNLLFMDEHSFTHETVSRRSVSFFLPINILLISLAGKMYLLHYGPVTMMDSWLFWKLALLTTLIWVCKDIVYQLIALVFFNSATLKRWKLGNTFIISFFSVSLIPLLLLNEAGVVIPSYFIYLWPSLFLLLPRLVYSLKGMNFFLAEKGGYFYMILYLCALEILPLMVFLKGVYLIQFNL